MTQQLESVVEQFKRIVEPDGGKLEVVGVEGDTLTINYTPGHNPDCEACVIEPDDLRELIGEAVKRHDPAITTIDIVTTASN